MTSRHWTIVILVAIGVLLALVGTTVVYVWQRARAEAVASPSESSSKTTISSLPSPDAKSAAPDSTASITSSSVGRSYQGTIDKRIKLFARITMGATDVSGRYFYDGGGDIELHGSRSGTHADLEERVGGKVTGLFSGDFDDQGRFSGTWRKSANATPKPVELTPIATSRNGSPLIVGRHQVKRTLKSTDKSGKCEFDLQWPEFFGFESPEREAALNKTFGADEAYLTGNCNEAANYRTEYKIARNAGGLLNLLVTAAGAAGGRAGGGGQSSLIAVPSGETIAPEAIWVANVEDVLSSALRRAAAAHLKVSPDAGGDPYSSDSLNLKALIESIRIGEGSAWIIQGDGIDFMSQEVGFDNAFLHLTKSELAPALAPQSPLRKILLN